MQCHSIAIAPKKLEVLEALISNFLISTSFFAIIKYVLAVFSLVFIDHQQLLQSLIEGKNILSSKIKFRERYWVSKKKDSGTCVIGLSFIV